jgi:teichuronic acid biosynthesis glycosyltransferase TuaG
MPNVRRGQDSATWLQMLRNGVKFMGQNEVLAQYRRVPNSLSANKLNALKRTWYLYRGVEKLSVAKSLWCMTGWAWHASLKRIYSKKFRK